VWPALDEAVGKLFPIGSLIVCCVVMAVCLARGRHRGTATYRRWRQRYTLEPRGVERLVWMCFNVCLTTVCLTVPLYVYQGLKDAAAITVDTVEALELDELIEAVGTQAQYQNTYDFVLVFSLCVCAVGRRRSTAVSASRSSSTSRRRRASAVNCAPSFTSADSSDAPLRIVHSTRTELK